MTVDNLYLQRALMIFNKLKQIIKKQKEEKNIEVNIWHKMHAQLQLHQITGINEASCLETR